MANFESKIRTIQWTNNVSRMVDQTLLPYEYKYVDIKTGQEMFDAIRNMIVRGAPAIGVSGAHGVALYALELQKENLSKEEFVSKLIEKANYMKTSRPTAVNLMWAVDKQIEVIEEQSAKCKMQNAEEAIQNIVTALIENGIKLEN